MQKALAQAGEQPCVCLGLDLELHAAALAYSALEPSRLQCFPGW